MTLCSSAPYSPTPSSTQLWKYGTPWAMVHDFLPSPNQARQPRSWLLLCALGLWAKCCLQWSCFQIEFISTERKYIKFPGYLIQSLKYLKNSVCFLWFEKNSPWYFQDDCEVILCSLSKLPLFKVLSIMKNKGTDIVNKGLEYFFLNHQFIT